MIPLVSRVPRFGPTLFTLELAALFHRGWNSPGSQLWTKACQSDGKYEEESVFWGEMEKRRLSLFPRLTNTVEQCSSSEASPDHFWGIFTFLDGLKKNWWAGFDPVSFQDCVNSNFFLWSFSLRAGLMISHSDFVMLSLETLHSHSNIPCLYFDFLHALQLQLFYLHWHCFSVHLKRLLYSDLSFCSWFFVCNKFINNPQPKEWQV